MEPLLPATSNDGISVGFGLGLASMSLFSFSYCAAAAIIYSGGAIGTIGVME